ncbi:hypothetical protein ACNKHS_09650 [Shigella flexneri]
MSWQVGGIPFAAISELRGIAARRIVVLAGFRVVQDIGNLLLMRRTERKGRIVEGLLRGSVSTYGRLGIFLPFKLRDRNVIAG